jgi:hypothetical protein
VRISSTADTCGKYIWGAHHGSSVCGIQCKLLHGSNHQHNHEHTKPPSIIPQRCHYLAPPDLTPPAMHRLCTPHASLQVQMSCMRNGRQTPRICPELVASVVAAQEDSRTRVIRLLMPARLLLWFSCKSTAARASWMLLLWPSWVWHVHLYECFAVRDALIWEQPDYDAITSRL